MSLTAAVMGLTHMTVESTTNHPFSKRLKYHVDSDVDCDFYIRFPGWTARDMATLILGGRTSSAAHG